LNNGSGIFYALTYLVMFALPILGVRGVERRAPMWLRLAAGSGFLMTALYVALSIFPIVQVRSQLAFTAKLLLLILVSNAVGTGIFLMAARAAVRPGELQERH
jgi:hypothetical protein